MDKYVVSRKLAEKLKAAGYPQTTKYGWDLTYADDWLRPVYQFPADTREAKFEGIAAAPLSDELLEQLKYRPIVKLIERAGGSWSAMIYFGRQIEDNIKLIDYATYPTDKPSDALAELWLWCKENGYIS